MADTPARAEFDALVEQLAVIEAIPDDQTTDEHIDLAGELAAQILSMPAPDEAALRWKLDFLIGSKVDSGQSTGSYPAGSTIAQTVADYRRFLPPEPERPATQEQRNAMSFKPIKCGFDYSNEQWALTHLPSVRIAALLLDDDDKGLEAKVRQMLETDGVVPGILDGLSNTKDHLEAVVDVLRLALMRCFLVLERMGFSPDNPPPEAPAD